MKQKYWATFAAGILAATSFSPTARAQTGAITKFFVAPGGVGNWNVDANWSPAGVPQLTDVPVIHAGREVTIDTVIPRVEDLIIADHDVGDVDGIVNILPGGALDVRDQMNLARGGGTTPVRGVLNQSGGTLNSAVLFLAFGSNTTADFNLSAGTVTLGNLWFRFGDGTLTQTGGTVNANGNLVLGEGGNGSGSAFYDMMGGVFNVALDANIGKGLGAELANSLGSMRISGGVATFGGLIFGNDPTDQITIAGSGILRVDTTFYGEGTAQADIAMGNILGNNLMVSTIDIEGKQYVEIKSLNVPLEGDYNGNGVVDAADYVVWRKNLGLMGGATTAQGDGTGDGNVMPDDYSFWSARFGNTGNAPAMALSIAIPEPSSLVLVVIAVFALGWPVHRPRSVRS